MSIGTLTIISPTLSSPFGRPESLDFENMITRNFPPESIVLEEKGTFELAPRSIQIKLNIASNQKFFKDGMIAKLTGKSKELHEAFREALEQRDSSKNDYPVTEIIFADHKFLYPIDLASLASALNTARNGYDVTLIYDLEDQSWQMVPKPLQKPVQKKANTLDLG